MRYLMILTYNGRNFNGLQKQNNTENTIQTIVENAIKYAKEKGFNTLILDTAGRLQIDTDMMAELLLIDRVFHFIFINSETTCCITLGIQIDYQNSLFFFRKTSGKINGCCGFSHTALLICNCYDSAHSLFLFSLFDLRQTVYHVFGKCSTAIFS